MMNLWKNFSKGYHDDEIDYDNDVPPQVIPQREPTMQEQMNEVMFKLGRIEAKLEILCKSK
jgi:hypothetical protein